MKESDVAIGQLYRVRIRGQVTIVHLVNESAGGGWGGVDIANRSPVRIGAANHLLCRCDHNGKALEATNGQTA